MSTLSSLKVGDVVVYRNTGGQLVTLLVDQVTSDIKNGHPGFGGEIVADEPGAGGAWGYSRQIVSINGRKVRP